MRMRRPHVFLQQSLVDSCEELEDLRFGDIQVHEWGGRDSGTFILNILGIKSARARWRWFDGGHGICP